MLSIKWKKSKTSGLDTLNAESLLYSRNTFYVSLAFLFQAMLVHGYIPDNLINVKIIPLVKNKCGDLSDMNNYMPVAIANVISKVF